MFIDHPGAGKLRSLTLDEYMGPLIPEHPARAELANIRALALDGMKTAQRLLQTEQKLLEAVQEIAQLREKIELLTAPPVAETSRAAQLAVQAGIVTWPKKACPVCGKEISTCPGPWASHMKGKHPETVQ